MDGCCDLMCEESREFCLAMVGRIKIGFAATADGGR